MLITWRRPRRRSKRSCARRLRFSSRLWRTGNWKSIFCGVPCAESRGTPEEHRSWRTCVYAEIRQQTEAQGSLTVERMCLLARVSRAGYYRSLAEAEPAREEIE